ncbi:MULTISPECIES: LysR substrate-binding domain-containing protein [unclassified Roseovarius]|uniref:LysR substrate-binding domain-containing protein n=1 Tax=unclassified Roseovarius TaxID=2614913 RepID=UPI00273EA3E7|nr:MULTISPECIES: LysR substrate-binding domain-containing protein [unclassified Roseovarius]
MSASSPRPNMPHLNALRAFEAAARLGSFSLAAEELYVTPAAVTQQIKSLEAWAGMVLFERHAQGVTLTDATRDALPTLTEAFDLLGSSVHTLVRKARPRAIKIAALPSIAQFWLSPRLSALRDAVPGLEISVTARETLPNLKREPFDLCLFLEKSSDASGAIPLAQDEIFPVCAPSVAQRLAKRADLAAETWLNDENWSGDWDRWVSATGGGIPQPASRPVFSLFGLALEEAINGAGVLIGHRLLVGKHLQSGALVAPFPDPVPLVRQLFLRIGLGAGEDPVIAEIVNLLSREAAVPAA